MNRLRPKTLLFLAVGLLMGAGISFILFGSATADSERLLKVPVSTVEMKAGHLIQKRDIEFIEITVGDWYEAPENNKLVGKIMKYDIPKGIPISNNYILKTKDREKRTVIRIPIDIYSMSSQPGIATLHALNKDGNSSKLANNVQILNYYNRMNEDISDANTKDKIPVAAEIRVKPSEEPIIKNAESTGKFYFSWEDSSS